MTSGHCYYFLCFSLPARLAFFRKYQKKKVPSKSTKLLPARAWSHSPLLASCMTRRLNSKTAKPTGIKGAPLSGGGMDGKNSEGELRVLEEGASKLKKDSLRDLLVCVGIFQAFDVVSSLEAQQRRGWSTTTVTFGRSLLRQQRRGKVWRWSSPWSGVVDKGYSLLPVFWGKCHGWGPCRGERFGEDAGKDMGLQSNEYFCDAVCGDIARKTSSPKGHRRLPRTGKLLNRLEAAQQHNRLAEQW